MQYFGKLSKRWRFDLSLLHLFTHITHTDTCKSHSKILKGRIYFICDLLFLLHILNSWNCFISSKSEIQTKFFLTKKKLHEIHKKTSILVQARIVLATHPTPPGKWLETVQMMHWFDSRPQYLSKRMSRQNVLVNTICSHFYL